MGRRWCTSLFHMNTRVAFRDVCFYSFCTYVRIRAFSVHFWVSALAGLVQPKCNREISRDLHRSFMPRPSRMVAKLTLAYSPRWPLVLSVV